MNDKKYPAKLRWKKEDKDALEKAVRNFNRRISELQRLGYKNLPKKESYEELRGIKDLQEGELSREIMNRRELDLKIASLNRFRENTAKSVSLPGGQEVTLWEKDEISRLKRRATVSLEAEIKDLYNSGKDKDWIKARERTLEHLDDIYNLKGAEFRKKMQVLENNARSDRELRYAQAWLDNYLYALDTAEGYTNKEVLINKIKRLKNPLKVYDYIKQEPILEDFLDDYTAGGTAQTYAGFTNNEEAFDDALKRLGLI